jgi:hypothetical protein
MNECLALSPLTSWFNLTNEGDIEFKNIRVASMS